ncbi:hypothetical protein Hypma_003403 [Hypsizygus marmoreus]|uniref:Uncharacterized protein n=1 Tax=Hypsizygus marmoreus TaxID=39966 RepID=A0A369J8N7_HYPMA|nr:hypothetical protein Hypma_003403 [Hypsizygus marmoreus]
MDPADANSALAVLADLGYTGLTEDLGKLRPPAEYKTELKFMAEILGVIQGRVIFAPWILIVLLTFCLTSSVS